MPTPNINFLRQRRKKLTSVQKTDRKYAMVMGYVFVGVLVATGVVFGIQLYLTNKLNTIKDAQVQAQSQITTLASVEQEYLTLAQKVSAIKTLIKGKALKQKAIEYFTALFAKQGVTLSELVFLDEGVIRFQVETKDVFQFRELLIVLESTEVRSLYPQIAIGDLSRADSAKYNVMISVKLDVPLPTAKVLPTPRPTLKI